METVNIHEAKTHLSRLVERAASGESIVIAKAGRPMVRLVAVDAPPMRRIGFMSGHVVVPDDFDDMVADLIADEFEGRC